MANRKALSKRLRFEVFKRDSFKCQYCGRSAPDVILEVDHIHPVAKDGENDITNLITACDSCNGGKSDKLLSDTAAASKRKAQLDQLQERREQLEMMADWQRGLIDLDEQATDHCVELLNALLQPMEVYMNPAARPALRAHVKKFGMAIVMEAIRDGFAGYVKRGDDGKVDQESWAQFWDKLGGICTIKRREKDNPEEAKLYRIKGLARKRIPGYFEDWKALRLLRAAVDAGVDTEDLWGAAGRAHSWSSFNGDVIDLINEAQGGEA